MTYDRRLEFDKEEELVDYIRKNLMTKELYTEMYKYNTTITDFLYQIFFDTWNAKLGRKEFGF